MEVQVRLAQSGQSYCYSQLSTVYALMQQIKKDFKIEESDQKLILKSGQTLKSSMAFDNIGQLMKKTIPTNQQIGNENNINFQDRNIMQISCLYVFNEKELLKPIQLDKNMNDSYFLRLSEQKTKIFSLGTSSYQLDDFCAHLNEKNIESLVESTVNKKLKVPIEGLKQKFSLFLQTLMKTKDYKMHMCQLLDKIQNQSKARKLLIRSVEYHLEKKLVGFKNLSAKIEKQAKLESEIALKGNSSFFSGKKVHSITEESEKLSDTKGCIQKQFKDLISRIKQEKRQVASKMFNEEQKILINIDKKVNSKLKQQEQWINSSKSLYNQLIDMISKSGSEKIDTKALSKVYQKILLNNKKASDILNQLMQMSISLHKIHLQGENKGIKKVFQMYVGLIKKLDEISIQASKLDKQYKQYLLEKQARDIKISQFYQSNGQLISEKYNMPLKQGIQIRSPKKKIDSSGSKSKEKENSIPKVNSPIKNKIGKNSLKSFNDQNNAKNTEIQGVNSAQLTRRLHFNRRIEGILKYSQWICSKQQQLRRNFRNSEQFQGNSIQQLSNFNVPFIQIDFSQTSDQEICQIYKKITKEQTALDWQQQLIQSTNLVNRTVTTYLASKSNATEREKNLEKILSILSQTFYTMMKKKIDVETSKIKQSISLQIQKKYQNKLNQLRRQNEDLNQKLWRIQQDIEEEDANTSVRLSETICKLQQIQKKYKQLEHLNQQLDDQNNRIVTKNKQLSENLKNYQLQMNQITDKLSNLENQYQQDSQQHKKQIQSLRALSKKQKQSLQNMKMEKADLKIKYQQNKKDLITQVEYSQTLIKGMEQLADEKQFYLNQFNDIKALLADKDIEIIKLQKLLKDVKLNNETEKETYLLQVNGQLQFSQTQKLQNQQTQKIDNQSLLKQFNGQVQVSPGKCKCQCSEQNENLKQQIQQMQEQITNLQKQLKNCLLQCKQTEDQEMQTEEQKQYKDKQNISQGSNLSIKAQTYKPVEQEMITHQMGNWGSNPVLSQYYLSSQAQQWSMHNKFGSISIGKSIEQGMCHLFLPFSNDLYIGVTINEDYKNYTSYQQFNNQVDNSGNNSPVYLLDLKSFNFKTNQMLRQCSLVLVVKVEKKQERGNKIMISGKIESAMGFQDEDMTLKNYAPFLED